MKKPSFLSRLAGMFEEEKQDREESAGIDRDVESTVAALKEAKAASLDGTDLLVKNWGRPGDMIYVMALAPFHAAWGENAERMAPMLVKNCDHVFRQHVPVGKGQGGVKGDLYFMRFAELNEAAGLLKAIAIINDIGVRMLGDGFKKLEAPALLVVADAGDITDGDGRLNLERAGKVVEKGGRPLSMAEPGEDAPEWLRLCWQSRLAAPVRTDTEWEAIKVRRRGDPGWVEHRSDRRRHKLIRAGEPERRGGRPRRADDRNTGKAW